jgi:hypothetical protein
MEQLHLIRAPRYQLSFALLHAEPYWISYKLGYPIRNLCLIDEIWYTIASPINAAISYRLSTLEKFSYFLVFSRRAAHHVVEEVKTSVAFMMGTAISHGYCRRTRPRLSLHEALRLNQKQQLSLINE